MQEAKEVFQFLHFEVLMTISDECEDFLTNTTKTALTVTCVT
jgi:hypothetical protein